VTDQQKPNDCCVDKPKNDWCFSCVAAAEKEKKEDWCFTCVHAPHPKDEEEECKDC